jgi:uncharacterized delta-60 repeat protein
MNFSINYSKISLFVFLCIFVFTFHTFSSDGSLDPSFGGTGKVTINFAALDDYGHAVAIQNDGKIVGVGQADVGGDFNWALIRLNTNGSLDGTFGVGGKVTTNMGDAQDSANDVAIQTDGKIVVVGNAATTGGSANFIIARYSSTGVLDAAFGTAGITSTNVSGTGNNIANSVAIQSDGKIVVVGLSGGNRFGVVRYTTSGVLDGSFGSGGIVITDVSGSGAFSIATDVVIQTDGKIVVAGYTTLGGVLTFAVARYNANGALDVTFGAGGISTTHIGVGSNDIASGVGLQLDGKIIVFGSSQPAIGNGKFAVVRYTTNGVLDTTFGTSGITLASVGTVDNNSGRVTIQVDDKIVGVGTAVFPLVDNFTVLRYTRDGILDTTFGGTGFVTTNFNNADEALGVAIQPDNKIVAIGGANFGEGTTNFALARYLVAPCLGVAQVGSDTEVGVFSVFQQITPGGRIAGLASVEDGFGLCGDAAFDSIFPVIGKICLNGFTLTLNRDLITHNTATISTMGNIVGNGNALDLAKSFVCIPSLDCPVAAGSIDNTVEWGNLAVSLNCDLCLQDVYITFTGESAINGHGQCLILDESSGILVNNGGTLLLKNIIIKGVNQSNIACLDNASTILLENVTWILDNNYTFSLGHFDVLTDFYVVGDGYNFLYQSIAQSSIGSNGVMTLERGVTFVYDPLTANRNLINLADSTSTLLLNGATLQSSSTGLQLLRGNLVADKRSFLSSSAVNQSEAIMFGDGISAANNLSSIIDPAATLELTSGFLVIADA